MAVRFTALDGVVGIDDKVRILESEVRALRLALQEWKALAERVDRIRDFCADTRDTVIRTSGRVGAIEGLNVAPHDAPPCPCGAPSLTVSRQWGPLCRACANKRCGYDVTPERAATGGYEAARKQIVVAIENAIGDDARFVRDNVIPEVNRAVGEDVVVIAKRSRLARARAWVNGRGAPAVTVATFAASMAAMAYFLGHVGEWLPIEIVRAMLP